MKILITTGLTRQDSGGPAQYGPRLKEEFEKLGHEVQLAQFGSIETALLKVWLKVLWADRVIALDTFSVGVPSLLAAMLFNKKLIVRIGGDFLWESYVERTSEKISLRQFNKNFPRLNSKEKIIRSLTRFLTSRASMLAFNTEWQKDIWSKSYDISSDRVCVIKNYIP